MDALEFLMERNRLCGSYRGCVGCAFGTADCVVRDMTSENTCKRIVAAVEQWSKEHPRKTRQSVFLEQWPNCSMGDDGVIGMCPRNVNKMYVCGSAGCADCRREFWMQEGE